MASGSTHVCLTAMLRARLRAERAFRRLEKRLEGGDAGLVADDDGDVAGSWREEGGGVSVSLC